jgi:flagellar biosynthesis chaperone FliJ
MDTMTVTNTEHLENLIEELKELVEERNESQELFEDANEAGDAHEADNLLDTITELNAAIEDTKANIEKELRSI